MQFGKTGVPKSQRVAFRGYDKPLKDVSAMFSQMGSQGPSDEDKDRLREIAGDIDHPVRSDMYNGLYAMSSMTADMIGDKIDELVAMGPEGEKELELMLGQLEAQNDAFESFTNSAIGDPGRDPYDAPTMGAARRRMMDEVDHRGRVNFTTPYDEMVKREERYTTGSISDRVVWDGQNIVFYKGQEKVDMAELLDPQTFATDLEARPPISGGEALESVYDPETFTSEEDVRAHIEDISFLEDVELDIAQMYIDEKRKTNPNFVSDPYTVINSDRMFKAAKEAYIKSAMEKFNSMNSGTEEPVEENDSGAVEENEMDRIKRGFDDEYGVGEFERAIEALGQGLGTEPDLPT